MRNQKRQSQEQMNHRDVYYFNNSIKKNPFISLAIMDKDGVQYYKGESGCEYPFKVPEFEQRIKDLAYGSEVLIDEAYLEANEWIPPTKFTSVVFCDNVKLTATKIEYKHRRNMTFVLKRDLFKYINEHEARRKSPLFFLLSQETLKFGAVELFNDYRVFDIMEVCEINSVPNDERESVHGVDIIRHSKRTNISTDETNRLNDIQKEYDGSNNGVVERFNENGTMKLKVTLDSTEVQGFQYDIIRYAKI